MSHLRIKHLVDPMRMHDSGRNLWSQDLALIPPVTPPNPLRFKAFVLINSGTKRTESPLKLDISPGLKPYKLTLQMKITVDGPTVLRPRAGAHNSTGHTPGALIPALIKDSHADTHT